MKPYKLILKLLPYLFSNKEVLYIYDGEPRGDVDGIIVTTEEIYLGSEDEFKYYKSTHKI